MERQMTLRYTVKTDVPRQLRDRGFVAYVEDAEHPDGSGAASCGWFLSLLDADRARDAMNYRDLIGSPNPERRAECSKIWPGL
jgi:hypothetical protein